MDLETRKLNAIQYLINLRDEKILNEIEATIYSAKTRKATKPIPFTGKQLVERAKRSNDDYLSGKFKTQDQLELESENW
jgi:hypothetical protein